jgi:hypothetical protein
MAEQNKTPPAEESRHIHPPSEDEFGRAGEEAAAKDVKDGPASLGGGAPGQSPPPVAGS